MTKVAFVLKLPVNFSLSGRTKERGIAVVIVSPVVWVRGVVVVVQRVVLDRSHLTGLGEPSDTSGADGAMVGGEVGGVGVGCDTS